jgi:hypothetical protein
VVECLTSKHEALNSKPQYQPKERKKKNPTQKRDDEVAQVVEHLQSKIEALNSNSSTTNKFRAGGVSQGIEEHLICKYKALSSNPSSTKKKTKKQKLALHILNPDSINWGLKYSLKKKKKKN